MLKEKNKTKKEKWLNERIENKRTFKYHQNVLFGITCTTKIECVETGDIFTIEYTKPKSKLRFAPELVKQVRLNMFKKDVWFKSRNKKKTDLICSNCSREYENLDCDIGLMFIEGSLNKHVCFDCGSKYILLGSEDVEKKINEAKNMKNALIEKIRGLGNYNEPGYYSKKLDDMGLDDLETLYNEKKSEKEEWDRIESIEIPESETGLEQYLIDEYGVIENTKWLKCVEQIEGFFKDCGYDLFDCGQGYAQREATAICKIGLKFYEVTIKAEIGSAKQDRGDRLYWVENIDSVDYKEVDKPLPKEKTSFNYKITLSDDKKNLLDSFLKKNQINFSNK